ncbi:MAG: NAD-dependent dehydratase [Bdellovibrionaceae bacterium]|nr:NAD-dependent dehydratase [Pseudobdellovibrionaceae bacterium]
MGKKLVTGGCGFIGSHIVEQLIKEDHQVCVIDNLSTGRLENVSKFSDSVEFIQADIATPGKWMDAFNGVEEVFHIAALADIVPSIQNPVAYFQSNVTGTLNVLEASKKANIKKIIYAASSSCYGITDQTPTPESATIQTEYPYALTKNLGEQLILHWEKVYGVPAISLRFFNVYGTRSRTSGTYGAVFGVFLAQKIANQPFTVVGDGTQVRDFVYVEDVARAAIMASQSSFTGKVYNIGTGTPASVNRIVEILGGDVVHLPKRPGEPDSTHADISAIQKDLGWKPLISIEEGIQRMLEQIDYWKNAPVWNKDSIAEQTKDWFKYLDK